MKVYHGSYTAIETIDFSFCQIKRDFGKGFYVTKFHDQAKVWSERKGKDNHSDAVVTEFDFSEFFFRDKDFKVLRFDDYSDEWLEFVVLNRKNETEQQAHDYDYTSKTYTLLADENTEFYKKSWQEIYELLKQELN